MSNIVTEASAKYKQTYGKLIKGDMFRIEVGGRIKMKTDAQGFSGITAIDLTSGDTYSYKTTQEVYPVTGVSIQRDRK